MEKVPLRCLAVLDRDTWPDLISDNCSRHLSSAVQKNCGCSGGHRGHGTIARKEVHRGSYRLFIAKELEISETIFPTYRNPDFNLVTIDWDAPV